MFFARATRWIDHDRIEELNLYARRDFHLAADNSLHREWGVVASSTGDVDTPADIRLWERQQADLAHFAQFADSQCLTPLLL